MRYFILHKVGKQEMIWTRTKEYEYIEDVPEVAIQTVSCPSADRCYKILSDAFGMRMAANTAKKKGFRLVSQAGVPTRRKSGALQIKPKIPMDASKTPDTEARKIQFLQELNKNTDECTEKIKEEKPVISVVESSVSAEERTEKERNVPEEPVLFPLGALDKKPVKSMVSVKIENSPFGIETETSVLNTDIETVKCNLQNIMRLIRSEQILARDEALLNSIQNDCLHAIEFGSFNVVDGYKQAKHLQELRQIRRQVKNVRRLAQNCAVFQNDIQALIDQIQIIQNQVYLPRYAPELFEHVEEIV